MKAGITSDELGTIRAILPKTRPTYIIVDDMEAPYRHAALNIKAQHECAIVAIKATTL